MPSSSLKIGVIHGKTRMGAKRGNTRRLAGLVQGLVEKHEVNLIVLPPYPFTGPIIGYYPPSKVKHVLSSYAERLGRSIASSSMILYPMRWSRELGVNILVGPVIERAGPRLYVTAIMIDSYGSITEKYRKIVLTREEEKYGIVRGKDPGILTIPGFNARIGVFIDEDLSHPEVFRAIQNHNANFIIGFMLPYNSETFTMVREENYMRTMDRKFIEYFLSVRSRETGLPMVLVGGIVEELGNHGYQAYMPTIPVEPDMGVIHDRIKGLEDADTYMVIDIDINASRSKPLTTASKEIIKKLCKEIKTK